MHLQAKGRSGSDTSKPSCCTRRSYIFRIFFRYNCLLHISIKNVTDLYAHAQTVDTRRSSPIFQAPGYEATGCLVKQAKSRQSRSKYMTVSKRVFPFSRQWHQVTPIAPPTGCGIRPVPNRNHRNTRRNNLRFQHGTATYTEYFNRILNWISGF